MNAEILSVGTELLLGDIINTNAQYLANELAHMGFGVLHQSVVGDNQERLAEEVHRAFSRSDILITTGGLGPTGDDITREIIAQVMGKKLVLDEQALESVHAYFQRLGREMGENNKKQVMLPEGCTVLKNEWGTAPACAVESAGKIAILLPGPPREMRPIFENYVKPYLAKFSSGAIESVTVREFGLSESKVEEILSDLMQGANPTLAPYAKTGEVVLRVTARAGNRAEALDRCRPLIDEVKKRLGDCVYGENVESLEQVLVHLLSERKLKIALAESCTGGLVAQRITGIPGASDVFECGVVSYANRIKEKELGVKHETLVKYGAVSVQTAHEMAAGILAAAGADIGVGITGIAGPGGGTPEKPVGLVFVGVCGFGKCYVRRLLLGHGGAERGLIRSLASLNALDMARRLALGLPQEDAGGGLTVFDL